MPEKPLMLKELLELDSSSESFRWPPLQQAAGTTLRRLLDTELSGVPAGDGGSSIQVRPHSKSALMRLSDVIRAVNALQFFTAGSGNSATILLHRSFSKKLRRGFWRRSSGEKESDFRSLSEEEAETSPLCSPSPVVSSCRSSPDGGGSACSDLRPLSTASSPQKEITVGVRDTFHRSSADNRQPKENCGNAVDCPLGEEKEQLSPVSVMEFPYKNNDDDDEVEQPSSTTSSSQQSLTGTETTKNQIDRVNLNHRFGCTETHFESAVHVASEDEGERRWRKAFSLLHHVADGEPLPGDEEKLLLHFFVEGLSLSAHCRRRAVEEEELIRVATEWVSGEVWEVENAGDALVGEMERSGGWRRFEEAEEEEVVVAGISRCLTAWLIDELVGELSLVA